MSDVLDPANGGRSMMIVKLLTQAAGWTILGGLLYQISVKAPMMLETQNASLREQRVVFTETLAKVQTQFAAMQDKQQEFFMTNLKEMTAATEKGSEERLASMKEALNTFREDSRENQRLIVNLIKASTMSREQVQKAIDDARGERRVVEPRSELDDK